jgi:hypothetical protein
MQLLAIALYNAAGDRRTVGFHPGELNIVTGVPRTGKSALLDITEYCLGRTTVTMPVGPITETVAWYAALLELPGGGRAFAARPAPRTGAATSQRAMLELGANLEIPEAGALEVNADADTVREQLGRLIGIGENRHEPEPGSLRSPLEANLGHALLMCFQRQGEIANRDLLFHRQGEEGIARAIQDTLPYFLGTVPADQALKRQQLTVARRDLRRAEVELQRAERLNEDVEVGLRGLLQEAYAKGLVGAADIQGRTEIIEALRAALRAQPAELPLDDQQIERRRELERQRSELRQALRNATDQRTLLEEQNGGEQNYRNVVNTQLARLQSIDLLGDGDASGEDGGYCPMCRLPLDEPDPTVDQLRTAAQTLRFQLTEVEVARPRLEAALTELDNESDRLRQELRAIEAALVGLAAGEAAIEQARARVEEAAFTKGRIDLYLGNLALAEDQMLTRLRQAVRVAQRRVDQLEAQLDPETERELLISRMAVIGQDMTSYADQLQLEHSGGNVRLDLRNLTVVADTESGPARLSRIGSGANWLGYHLVAHLGLHRYFVRHQRPVPRLLMLDQPTQVYYPSDVEQRDGILAGDDDRAAVRRLFRLMRDVVSDLAPNFQIIVCDHANLPEDWFQKAVRHNWRDGRKLIPDEWIE